METVLGIVVAAVAVYGAILSTANYLARRQATRPQVVVRISNGFLVYGPELGDPLLMLEAANAGERPVTLSSHGLHLPDGRQVLFLRPLMPVNFPHELAPGKSCTVGTELKGLAETLADEGWHGKVDLIGFYRDQVGNEYRSEPWRFDVAGWVH